MGFPRTIIKKKLGYELLVTSCCGHEMLVSCLVVLFTLEIVLSYFSQVMSI